MKKYVIAQFSMGDSDVKMILIETLKKALDKYVEDSSLGFEYIDGKTTVQEIMDEYVASWNL